MSRAGMTIAEKILARAAGRTAVRPGEDIWARADTAVLCDLGWTLVGPPIAELGGQVTDPERVVVVFDHTVANDPRSEGLRRQWREFCREHGITRLHDSGADGISHVLSVQKGYARPGTLQVSVDTHANTCGAVGCFATAMGMDIVADLMLGANWYTVPESVRVRLDGALAPGVSVRDVAQRVMSDVGTELGGGRVIELVGSFVDSASVPALMTLCNWTRKTGAVTGIVNPSPATLAYVQDRTAAALAPLYSDPGATYVEELGYDVSALGPVVAAPPDPLNILDVAELEGTRIDHVFIGSCAGGSIEDLRAAAEVLRGRHVHPDVRAVASPGSRETLRAATAEGLVEILTQAGVDVTDATCGACYGGGDTLDDDDVCLSTSTENFPGRMGSQRASIFLAAPLTVAASAVTGRITHPGRQARA
jgi:3-isopropylmalate/(R)-2-methylmalate dehydratase large subunit